MVKMRRARLVGTVVILMMIVPLSEPPWRLVSSGPTLFWMDETARRFDQKFPSGIVEDSGTNTTAAQPATNPQTPATNNLNTDNQSKSGHHDQSQ
jgi:hypothetical protein